MQHGIRNFGPNGFSYRTGIGPLGAIFGGLIALGVVILIIIGIVALINAIVGGNRRAMSASPVQPAQQIQPSAAAPARTCPSCGKPMMEDWKNCPYDGTPLT
jgi:predicted lipid-binding transport protein (Tim44 family)